MTEKELKSQISLGLFDRGYFIKNFKQICDCIERSTDMEFLKNFDATFSFLKQQSKNTSLTFFILVPALEDIINQRLKEPF